MCIQKKIVKILKKKCLGEYHDLYVESDTLLSAGELENIWNIFLEIYGLDPSHKPSHQD